MTKFITVIRYCSHAAKPQNCSVKKENNEKLQTFGHFFGTTTLGPEAILKHHRIWSNLTLLLAFLIYFASYYKCSRNQRSRKEAFFVQAFIGSDISLTLISCMLQISMIYYIPPLPGTSTFFCEMA